jgi:predicted RNase H-like HicB family nuclease
MNQSIRVDYTVQIWKEGNQFVAHAMPLDVMSAGDTAEEARKALDEAVRLFLTTAAEAGTLEEVLEETGYERKEEGTWMSPDWVALERHTATFGG